VGGHWGLFTDAGRSPKFAWGQPVSNHPAWPWQAGAGVVLALATCAAAWIAANRRGLAKVGARHWAGVGINAVVCGVVIGWALANVPVEGLGPGGWLKSLVMSALAIAAPIVASATLLAGRPLPAFGAILARRTEETPDRLLAAAGWLLIATAIITVQTALGLVFDPRYRDFPFAPLTAATVPFLVLALIGQRERGSRGNAETLAAATLALSTVYIAFNEGFANWQSLWLCVVQLVLAFTLVRSRDAQSS